MANDQTMRLNQTIEGAIEQLYGKGSLANQLERYQKLALAFVTEFGQGRLDFFSSPGRTEILGNHTDHNHGLVLAASIDMDTIAVARANDCSQLRMVSLEYNQQLTIDLEEAKAESPSSNEGGTEALLKGIVAGFRQKGYQVNGFDVCLSTNVISAAGVSSSASFEMLICQIIDTFFNQSKIPIIDYALIGQYAENHYWDKGSGLLDQLACGVGGAVTIDFIQPSSPFIEKLEFDYRQMGYQLLIINTGKGHADLSADYSQVPNEMKAVAVFFGKQTLAEVNEQEFLEKIPSLRRQEGVGDRAILRALHFFEENRRVKRAVESVRQNHMTELLAMIVESGDSSWEWLQNAYTIQDYAEQSVSLALALTKIYANKHQTAGKIAFRLHGGGFAGTMMCALPSELVEDYVAYMSHYVGEENVYRMAIRKTGVIHLGGQ